LHPGLGVTLLQEDQIAQVMGITAGMLSLLILEIRSVIVVHHIARVRLELIDRVDATSLGPSRELYF
jgi:hypothetical protein